MVVHQNGDLDRPVDRANWRKQGSLKVRRTTIQDEPPSRAAALAVTLLHDEGQMSEELAGMLVFWGELREARSRHVGDEIERDRNFLHPSIPGQRLWIDPERKRFDLVEG